MTLLSDQSSAVISSEEVECGSLYGIRREDQRLCMHDCSEDRDQDTIASDVMINADIPSACIFDFPNIRNEVFWHRIRLQHFQVVGLDKSTAHHDPQVLLVEHDRGTTCFGALLDFRRSSHESSRRRRMCRTETTSLSHSALHQPKRADNFQCHAGACA